MSRHCLRGHLTTTDPCEQCGGEVETTLLRQDQRPPSGARCTQCGMDSDPAATFCEACGTPLSNRPNPQLDEAGAITGSVGTASRPATTSTPTYRHQMTAPTAPSPPTSEPWLIERSTDLGWHASQHATGTPPPPADPDRVTVRSATVLVGRESGPAPVRPDIECADDTAVSRAHCRLTTDGRRWWVEDLGSSNGTYLRRRGSPLPTHRLPAGRQHELLEGDRLYLGAWTRIGIRRALPGEF